MYSLYSGKEQGIRGKNRIQTGPAGLGQAKDRRKGPGVRGELAGAAGFEPATTGFGDQRSGQTELRSCAPVIIAPLRSVFNAGLRRSQATLKRSHRGLPRQCVSCANRRGNNIKFRHTVSLSRGRGYRGAGHPYYSQARLCSSERCPISLGPSLCSGRASGFLRWATGWVTSSSKSEAVAVSRAGLRLRIHPFLTKAKTARPATGHGLRLRIHPFLAKAKTARPAAGHGLRLRIDPFLAKDRESLLPLICRVRRRWGECGYRIRGGAEVGSCTGYSK